MEAALTQFLNGLSFVAIFGLIGVGLAVLLGMMGVINLAHGEFVMLRSLCGLVVWFCFPQLLDRTHFGRHRGWVVQLAH